LDRTFEVEEGDDFFRVKLADSLPRLLYLFNAYEAAPSVEVRTIRPRVETLLQKEVAFFPAFSFTLDSLTTAAYWGAREYILAPSFWSARELSSAVAVAPTNATYSLVGLLWPHRILDFSTNNMREDLRNLSKEYIFNALLPPTFSEDGRYCPLNGSSIITIANRSVRIINLHKVVFTAEPDTKRSGLWRASVMTSNLQFRSITCKLCYGSEDLSGGGIIDGLMIADVRIVGRRYLKPHFFLYPYRHPSLGEEYGVTLTLLSTALRMAYLRSKKPIFIETRRVETILQKMLSSLLKIRAGTLPDLAARILRRRGIAEVAKHLGVYAPTSGGVVYLHPYFIDALIKIFGGLRELPDGIISTFVCKAPVKIANILANPTWHADFASKLSISDWLRKTLGVSGFSAQKVFLKACSRLSGISRLAKMINYTNPETILQT